jgi:glycosyltransferase involved in cell wall biosynthesis
VKIAYLFGGRFDPIALGGNAVDIREDLAGFDGLGFEVEFRAFESSPLGVFPSIRAAKSRVPTPAWSAARDIALYRKNRIWKQRLLSDAHLRDAKLVFEYWAPDSFGGWALANKRSLPYVLENLDPITDERRAKGRSLLNGRAQERERRRRQEADALIVMARGMADYLAEEWGVDRARVHWLPQGVNTALFSPRPPDTRAAKRTELGMTDGDFVVGFVGSMADYHRVDVLVEAIRRIQSRRRGVRLVLLGGSPERTKELGAEFLATVVPHVEYERVPDFISAFDVAILPDSNWYGSPMKVLEYAAVGVSVIAPDIGPVRDLMSRDDEVALIPPGDVEALAASIERALDNPEEASARAELFGATVRRRFDRSDRAQKLVALCEDLITRGRRG